MKVICSAEGLMEIAADKGLGLYELAAITRSATSTLRKIFDGKPVSLKTANRIYKTLGKDPRLKICYDSRESKAV